MPRGTPQDPSLVFFIICIALAIPAMILWGKYVLKPLYTFLSKKTKKTLL